MLDNIDKEVFMHAQLFLILLRPHGLWPSRILCLWDFPGKNTRVGCHFLLQEMFQIQRSNLHLLHLQHGYY